VATHITSKGVEFATVEDCVQALLRIAADKSIHSTFSQPEMLEVVSKQFSLGQAFGIVPKTVDKNGYLDLDHDDFKHGDMADDLQQQASSVG
jgi:hypothetical protein